jgi:hypothetical protein
MEKSMEALRHAQAKSAELEKNNKRFQEQVLAGRKEIARLKEELQVFKTKVLPWINLADGYHWGSPHPHSKIDFPLPKVYVENRIPVLS